MSALEKLKTKLIKYPQLEVEGKGNEITIKAQDEQGFDITLYDDSGILTVAFGNWHCEFDTEEEALNIIAFGLSDECRLRELKKGKTIYKWVVESFVNGNWVHSYTTGLIFYPYWKSTTEIVYRNYVISS
jgi:hypothetical protein